MAVVSSDDIWAVGYYGTDAATPLQTLIEHWNGKAWSVVSSANPSKEYSLLYGVSAISRTDVWAVGVTSPPSNLTTQSLIEHWNGKTWSVIPSPSTPSWPNNNLQGIVARSHNDVWAVGYASSTFNGPDQSLIEHWNGKTWSVVPGPGPLLTNGKSDLEGVTALSATNIWAVGYVAETTTNQALIEHWNGKTWSVVSSPTQSDSQLYGITAIRENDIWAVGQTNSPFQALVEHWNGKAWSIIPGPTIPTSEASLLEGVTARSRNDVWAVGSFYTPSTAFSGPAPFSHSLIEHWNGKTWSVVSSANPGLDVDINAVAVFAGHEAWAVGDFYSGFNSQPLFEYWNGKVWKVK